MFSLALFLGGFQSTVTAETTVQPGANSTGTNSRPANSEANTLQDPPSQQESKSGQVPQPAAPIKIAERLGPQVDPCVTLSVEGDNWLDQVHGFVQDKTCEPAIWFDTFFVKDHVLLDLRPGALIILRNSALWSEGQSVASISDFRLEWQLPQWKKFLRRSRLYFESSSGADKYTSEPGQPVQPGVDKETGVRQTIIGARVDLFTRLRSLAAFDSGVKIGLHPEAHIRMRYQYAEPFSEVYLLRFSDIALWQTTKQFSNTVQFDIERTMTTFTLFRWGNNVTYIEGTPGVTWNTGIGLFTQLTTKSAISYNAGLWGVNHPHWRIQNYRVGTHYRRNFYRPWLFLELAPDVSWPKDASGHRNSKYAFMATLEIVFGK